MDKQPELCKNERKTKCLFLILVQCKIAALATMPGQEPIDKEKLTKDTVIKK